MKIKPEDLIKMKNKDVNEPDDVSEPMEDDIEWDDYVNLDVIPSNSYRNDDGEWEKIH